MAAGNVLGQGEKMELGDVRSWDHGPGLLFQNVVAVNARDMDGPGFKAGISSLQSLCLQHCTGQPSWEQIPELINPHQVLLPVKLV